MDNVAGFILAGGASSRMGRDKSHLLLGNQTFTEHIAAELDEVCGSVTIVGGQETSDRFKHVQDSFPKVGALGGLHGALAACEGEWALIVACDLPFVNASLFRRLYSLRSGHEAVVPVQQDGRLQPLCALYQKSNCLDCATDLIRAGKRRPIDLLQMVNTRFVSFSEIEDLDQANKFFVNINTPEDYDVALRL